MGQRVVSLDPGGTTGYCIAYIEGSEQLHLTYGQHAWRESDLWDALWSLKPDYLVCESFEYRQNSRAGLDLSPAHLIGVVRLFHDKHGCKLNMQTAAQGKGFWTDKKLKEFSLYNAKFRHGRDAVRHFLHWYSFGPGFQYHSNAKFNLVEEQYMLDSYFERVVL